MLSRKIRSSKNKSAILKIRLQSLKQNRKLAQNRSRRFLLLLKRMMCLQKQVLQKRI